MLSNVWMVLLKSGLAFSLLIPLTVCQVSQSIKIGYVGSATTIPCPVAVKVTYPLWRGPPNDTRIYDPRTNMFNPHLGEKTKRLSIAADNSSLRVADSKLLDAGTYSCVGSVENSTYQGSVTVEIRIQPAKPEIVASATTDENGIRATEEQNLTVTCTSRGGYPAPTVAWYKGVTTGQPVAQINTGTQDGDTFTVTLLYTFTPKRQDDGQNLVCRSYWPEPADAQGILEETVTLYLYLKPRQTIVNQTNNAVAGKDVTVQCTASDCRPAANISWTYKGQSYSPNVTYAIDTATQTFTTVSVLRRPVTASDNKQTAICRVSHRALVNDLDASASLNVQFRPLEVSVNKPTGNVIANGQNPMLISCITGTSNPVSDITWVTGSIQSDTPSHMDSPGAYGGRVRTSTIRLYPTRDHDGATVGCKARNDPTEQHEVSNSTVIDNVIYSPLLVDINDKDVIEGDSVALSCYASSKPPAYFTWRNIVNIVVTNGSGSATYNGLNYTINNASRTQTGTYTCTADNQVQPTDSKQTKLKVLYPPDITVLAINTTVNSSSTTVTCNASGVPDNYSYDTWLHTLNGHVVTHQESLPATRVLTLTGLSYAHSGVYTCGASNGVKKRVHGAAYLLVKSPPIVIGDVANKKELKVSGRLMQTVMVTFQYYSNAGRSSVTVQKVNGTGEVVEYNDLRNVSIKLPVFKSEINSTGIEVTINITIAEMSRFGEYDVFINNDIGRVQFSLIIQPQGRPETPVLINITILNHRSVEIMWKPGFPNGLNQTFTIQLSTDNNTWSNFSKDGGLELHTTHIKIIDNLASSQLYFVRMLAFNAKGESELTEILSFKTEASPEPPTSSPIGLIAGGAAGGVVAAVVVIAVIIIIIRRRRASRSSGKSKDKGALVMSSNLNVRNDEEDEEVINRLYESASSSKTDTSDSTSKQVPLADIGGIYAMVKKKPEAVYAMPNRQIGKKKEKQLKLNANKSGDVYENALCITSGNGSSPQSGESVYEVTSISAPAAPKKPLGTDGLLYAELEFAPKKKGPTKIIGIEDRCEYTTIDLTKKVKTLPDSDDEDKPKY